MTNPAYSDSVEIFIPLLTSLSGVLDKAAAHAASRDIDPAVFVNASLAPDMFPLATQVRIACDTAKDSLALLLGRQAPNLEHDDRTIDDLKARIAQTLTHLGELDPAAFEGLDARDITLPLPVNGNLELAATGSEYLRLWTLPHFFFHVVTAYDILRHNGVVIGKQDYMSHVGRYIRARTG